MALKQKLSKMPDCKCGHAYAVHIKTGPASGGPGYEDDHCGACMCDGYKADIELNEPADNIIFVGNTGFEADPDHLIVLQDEFKSGYECQRCFDKEHRIKTGGLDGQTESIIDCENCNGEGYYSRQTTDNVLRIKCSICKGTGKIPCPECDGKGSPSVVMPENTKGRPTTGIVVSCGANVQNYKLGDRVCYPSFSGHAFDLTGVDGDGKTVERTLVIHIERDILAKVHGTLEKRMVKQSAALHTLA